jgi:hypothetical protein
MKTIKVALSTLLVSTFISAFIAGVPGCSDERGAPPPVVDRMREPSRYGFVFDESTIKAEIAARCEKSAPTEAAACVDRIRKASQGEGMSFAVDARGEPVLRSYALDAAGKEESVAEANVKVVGVNERTARITTLASRGTRPWRYGTERTITWLDDHTFAVEDRGERFVYRRL